ncbi:MAG: hypothetical protein A2Y15_09350 [Clostridiales bacterium GWF2_36_10]|nr:MAG: hypothetical protein A2Y15_09350 [Clostridiales bacterium GWF2_36_10]HAN21415.1 hypothetical protein [Clostridiales bacterium]
MEIVPVKNRKTQTKIQTLTLILVIAIPFIVFKFFPATSIEQIEDTNGSDTTIVTFNIKDSFLNNKGDIVNSDSVSTEGSSSKKNMDIIEEVDFDTVKYSFVKFSGTKIIQQTEASGKMEFSISSQIIEGNFQAAIFKDGKFVKSFNAGEKVTITFDDVGIYTIIIGGESASGSVTAQRQS